MPEIWPELRQLSSGGDVPPGPGRDAAAPTQSTVNRAEGAFLRREEQRLAKVLEQALAGAPGAEPEAN